MLIKSTGDCISHSFHHDVDSIRWRCQNSLWSTIDFVIEDTLRVNLSRLSRVLGTSLWVMAVQEKWHDN